jgi:MFS transporter, FSR family, fosmidomycin resistance protein
MAAGLSIGLSIGLGGIAAICVGALADTFGLTAALWTTPLGALAGALLTLLLPSDSH